ncbi:MAG: aldo/keto reductase [Leptospiraceae bacterium]|nr:aldo/keto reductase [Leptospiraceae bacterium]MCK6381069.1 aldo/keto reductase [Leptospiraceae bacterium]NUM42655.1 aldo/keto reductase [Leptospiraceae bacterium]
MRKRRLGKSGIMVSEIGMGTMTFGSQTEEKESFRIMDKAFDAGIDFFDTAEIYPVPPDEKYVHRTEEIVGKWLSEKPRDAILLATKVCAPGYGWFTPPVRSGKTALDRRSIMIAIEGSLKRLKTDYVDLYQTHWTDPDFPYDETMEALTTLVKAGKVRYVGCSNETARGLMKSLWVSDKNNFVRYETIQNNFSILNRRFEDAIAEVCRKEQVSLLPFSPMAGGVLTGKYNSDNPPEEARFSRYKKSGDRQKKMIKRFVNPETLSSTAELIKIAEEINLSVTTLAVAWSKQHDFVASTLIGATSADQLDDSLKAAGLILDDETLKKIDDVSKKFPYPMG